MRRATPRRRSGRASDGGHKVVYLVRGRRAYLPGPFTLVEAVGQVRQIKRHGMTAWVEDASGTFVPVAGVRRQPEFLP